MSDTTIELAKQVGAEINEDAIIFAPHNELESFRTLIEAPKDKRIAELERKLDAEENAHAELQSRCYDGCATGSSIFDDFKELEAERDELRAHVDMLKNGYIENTTALYVCRDGNNIMQARLRAEALYNCNVIPSQSLEAHDRDVRNKVRMECAAECDSVLGKVCRDNPYDSAYSDGCDACQEAIEATIEKE